MSLSALIISFFIGIIFVLVWGLLSYVASSEAEFKSFFFGGLANFVFFIGGLIASYLSQFATIPSGEASLQVSPTPYHSEFSVIVALYIAFVTIFVAVIINLFQEALASSLAKMELLGTVSFKPDGYRDIQLFVGGMIGILSFSCALVYGLYLGSVRPGITYITVLTGVAISLGVQCIIYALFGIFFDYQVFRILSVSSPEILGLFGPGLRKIFGAGITLSIAFFIAVLWTTLLWASIKLGSTLSR